MMGKLTILLFAVLTIGAYGWITVYPNAREVQDQLQASVNAALSRPGMEWSAAEVDGQTAIVSGHAPSLAARDEALNLVLTAAGDGGPIMGGVVEVVDRTTVAGLQPRTRERSPAAAEPVVPKGTELERSAVPAIRTPFIWRVSSSGSVAVLAGSVPNEAARAALLQQARQQFTVVDDAMTIATDPPAGDWQAAAQLALAQLSQLERGTAELADSRLSIQGDAADAGAVAAVEAALSKLPAGYHGTQQLTYKKAAVAEAAPVPPQKPALEPAPPPVVQAMARAPVPKPGAAAAECEQQIAGAMGKATIRFAMQSAEIEKASLAQLDRVAKVLKRCDDVRVLIGGHTDAKGREAYNRSLSLDRARSVRDYLAGAGVPRERMQVAGYGSSRPIATNETEDGRTRNRRITFEASEP
ncbi:MAG TPA: OmpA family protein [Defluviicoccus sp.]|nr:OmpA family protein [Defluviicoccus sp.]